MKILELKKNVLLVLALVFIAIASLLQVLNQKGYDNYIKLREEFVEVDCIVVSVDTTLQTATIEYVYEHITYSVTYTTTQYEVMDVFTGVIRPEKPEALKFDNGYSMWNIYSVCSIALVSFALFLISVIIKRLIVKAICIKGEKYRIKVLEINKLSYLRQLILIFNGKEIKSEYFRTFQNISLLQDDIYVELKLL